MVTFEKAVVLEFLVVEKREDEMESSSNGFEKESDTKSSLGNEFY